MSMSTVTVRLDASTKETAATILGDLGLDLSTAVRMFLRQLVIRGQMPIELVQDHFYSQRNQASLRESIAQLNRGEVVTRTLEELQALE